MSSGSGARHSPCQGMIRCKRYLPVCSPGLSLCTQEGINQLVEQALSNLQHKERCEFSAVLCAELKPATMPDHSSLCLNVHGHVGVVQYFKKLFDLEMEQQLYTKNIQLMVMHGMHLEIHMDPMLAWGAQVQDVRGSPYLWLISTDSSGLLAATLGCQSKCKVTGVILKVDGESCSSVASFCNKKTNNTSALCLEIAIPRSLECEVHRQISINGNVRLKKKSSWPSTTVETGKSPPQPPQQFSQYPQNQGSMANLCDANGTQSTSNTSVVPCMGSWVPAPIHTDKPLEPVKEIVHDPDEILEYTLEKGTCNDFIEKINEGTIAMMICPVNSLQAWERRMKERLLQQKGGKQEQKDVENKLVVIKTCIEAYTAVLHIRALQHLTKLDVSFGLITNIQLANGLSPQAGSYLVVKFVWVYPDKNSEEEGLLIREPFDAQKPLQFLDLRMLPSQSINYDKRNLLGRKLVIKLFLEDGQSQDKLDYKLGDIVYNLADLGKMCPRYGDWQALSNKFEKTERLVSASLNIHVRCNMPEEVSVTENALENQRILESAVGRIEKFNNDEINHFLGCQLSPDLKVSKDLTLLEAAVWVMQEKTVCTILRLCSHLQMEVDTRAVFLAKQMLEKQQSTPGPVSDRTRNKILTLKRILNLLKGESKPSKAVQKLRCTNIGHPTRGKTMNDTTSAQSKRRVPPHSSYNEIIVLDDSESDVEPDTALISVADNKIESERKEDPLLAHKMSRSKDSSEDEDSRKRTACPTRLGNDKSKRLREPGDHDLPKLHRTWRCNSEPCTSFGLPQGCIRGNKCEFAHIKPITQEIMNQNVVISQAVARFPHLKDIDDCVEVRVETDGTSNPWYTASYQDPLTRTIYCSEWGPTGRRSREDLWWYPSESEARKAVSAVVCLWYSNA